MSSGLNQKLDYLDGMRALMAFNVIICHFVCVYYPTMYFAGYAESSFQGLTIFSTTPLSVLVNGNIAVMYFFALTGFLVGLNVFTKQRSEQYIEKKVIMRYCRLLPVVLVATLFAFVLMVLHLNKHLLITNPEVNRSFLEGYCNFTPTLTSLISNIFYSPFLINSDYIGPFWTIKFEFWGYILTLIAASVLKHSKWRRVWYIALGLLISYHLDGRYAVFIMGLFMADLIFNSNPTILNGLYHRWLDNKYFLMACFAVSVYFSCCPLQPSAFWAKFYFLSQTLMRGFGISLFIFVAVNSKIIQKILSIKPLVILGNISYEVYALHWPIMLSVEAGLFLVFEKYLSYNAAAIFAFVITVPIIYLISFFVNYFIKKLTTVRL